MKTYLINDSGLAELAASLKHQCGLAFNLASEYDKRKLTFWAMDAESDMDKGYPHGIVELPASHTISGRIETITLYPEHFDVREIADEE